MHLDMLPVIDQLTCSERVKLGILVVTAPKYLQLSLYNWSVSSYVVAMLDGKSYQIGPRYNLYIYSRERPKSAVEPVLFLPWREGHLLKKE